MVLVLVKFFCQSGANACTAAGNKIMCQIKAASQWWLEIKSVGLYERCFELKIKSPSLCYQPLDDPSLYHCLASNVIVNEYLFCKKVYGIDACIARF